MNDKEFKTKISYDLNEALAEFLGLFILWSIILIPVMIKQL